jgi:hypothetical protein
MQLRCSGRRQIVVVVTTLRRTGSTRAMILRWDWSRGSSHPLASGRVSGYDRDVVISSLKIYEELSETMEPTAARKLASILDSLYQDLKQTVSVYGDGAWGGRVWP